MSTITLFSDRAAQVLGSLAKEHGLRMEKPDATTVVMRKDGYAIAVVQDRDGISCMYYDTTSPSKPGYNLGMYLITNRRSQLKLDAGALGVAGDELVAVERHLRTAQDILAGSRAWLADYGWPPVAAPDYIR